MATTMSSSSVAFAHLDFDSQMLASKHGLQITDTMWQDSGRKWGSATGDNISDVTFSIMNPSGITSIKQKLPVIGNPRFDDVTADMAIDKIHVTVGNESNSSLKKIPLKDLLENKGGYLKTNSDHGSIVVPSLYVPERDSQVLVSAQYGVLPLHSGKCDFGIDLYNYQSYDREHPGVLVIVASQQGTSAQTVSTGTTTLYFNNNGDAANYVVQRLEEERKDRGATTGKPLSSDEKETTMLMIIQVPLKDLPRTTCECPSLTTSPQSMSISSPPYSPFGSFDYQGNGSYSIQSTMDFDMPVFKSFNFNTSTTSHYSGLSDLDMPVFRSLPSPVKKDMDYGVIKAGVTHSKFVGINVKQVIRNEALPIRITMMFYKVTDDATIPEAEFVDMAATIGKVYTSGHTQGSLVTDLFIDRLTASKDTKAASSGYGHPFVLQIPKEGPRLFDF
jgi:hypothetical protein